MKIETRYEYPEPEPVKKTVLDKTWGALLDNLYGRPSGKHSKGLTVEQIKNKRQVDYIVWEGPIRILSPEPERAVVWMNLPADPDGIDGYPALKEMT